MEFLQVIERFAILVFGAGHPAINYLLLLAIADDALGMAASPKDATEHAAVGKRRLLKSTGFGVFSFFPFAIFFLGDRRVADISQVHRRTFFFDPWLFLNCFFISCLRPSLL